MSGEHDVRVYLIDKVGFLSVGKAYVTNSSNSIILDMNARSELIFRQKKDMPYTLAPYPIPENYDGWRSLIEPGTIVYPSCDVDTPSMGLGAARDFHPTIIEVVTMTRAELDGYVRQQRKKLAQYCESCEALASQTSVFDERLRAYERAIERRKAQMAESLPPIPGLVSIIKETEN